MWTGGWPPWPSYDDRTVAAVEAVVRSGRWSVTGPWVGHQPLERVFAQRFADYCGVPYAVATDHGTSGLVIALQSVGVGAGDEVVVPALTWVGTATAVLACNAVPVVVDVDPGTGCLDPAEFEAAITARTRAVIPVHLHCRMADMDAIVEVAERYDVAVVEDCAQAHGAVWRGRRAGAFGAVGAFSLQQGKVLTCGEGGVAVTQDPDLHDRLQQLRADSRKYRADDPPFGHPQLVDIGELMGTNYCLPELSAALALDQLDRLDGQVRRRATAAAWLDEQLSELPGLMPLRQDAALELPSVFEYAIRRDPGAFAGVPTETVCSALEAELGVRVFMTDRPLHENVLYQPRTNPRNRWLDERLAHTEHWRHAHAQALWESLILLPHRVLLAEPLALQAVVSAFEKVLASAGHLAAHWTNHDGHRHSSDHLPST